MTRLSGKNIVVQSQTASNGLPSDFNKDDFDAQIKTKGYEVIFEKAYLCPCKSRESDNRVTCLNCGGVGWIFANPTKTNMVITGIMLDDKLKEGPLKEWGQIDKGACKITSYDGNKLSYMDRVTNIDATAEHNQILYPKLTDDDSQLFAYTKYDIKSIDYIALFIDTDTKLQRLQEPDDYTFRDNVILFDSQYNSIENICVTIRYVHHPVVHVIEILRESITSPALQGSTKLILPVHAVAMRAHLIPDVENFDGDRLYDNSWLPDSCELEQLTKFERQLRYTSAQAIYDDLTDVQKAELLALLEQDDSLLLEGGGHILLEG